MEEVRQCQNCDGPIVKRENENNFRYKSRKFCKNDCYHEYMRKNKLGWHQSFRAHYESNAAKAS
jgi:hypothetical protein